MTATTPEVVAREWSAVELRRLSILERDQILAAAATQAYVDYKCDKSLTDFEAFGEEDLHGCSSNTQSR